MKHKENNMWEQYDRMFKDAVVKCKRSCDISYAEMCEVISSADHHAGGNMSPDDVLNYSASGEKIMIPFWFIEAVEYLEQEGLL
jgi:hypothetical protein